MNKDRRKKLDGAIAAIEALKGSMDEIKSIIETAASEERDYFENMSENLQGGDKGQEADQAATNLEEVQSTLEELDLDDLITKINEAQGS